MRLCGFRDRHEFSLQTVKVTVSHQLQVAALTTAQGEGEACYSHLSKKLAGFTCQESSSLSITADWELLCLPFCRLNWGGGGNFHLIQAQTCSLESEVNLSQKFGKPFQPNCSYTAPEDLGRYHCKHLISLACSGALYSSITSATAAWTAQVNQP